MDLNAAPGADFLAFFDAVHAANMASSKQPSRAHIPTISFNATLSGCGGIFRYDLATLRAAATVDDFFEVSRSKFSSSTIELKVRTIASLNVKLYTLGAVQVAGCKNHVEFMHAMQHLAVLLDRAYPASAPHRMTSPAGGVIAMMNFNVAFPFGIRVTEFAREARRRGVYAEQPEKPPLCILRSSHTATATAMAYKTGKIILSTKCPRACAALYATVLGILEAPDVTEPLTPDMRVRASRRYHFTQLIWAGMPGALHTHNPCSAVPVPGCRRCQITK